MIKNRNFYKNFFMLCLPIMLQNVISLSVNLADNLMLGRYAEASLSGVTAVNQIQFIYAQLISGCGDTVVILASQYWGRQEVGRIKRVSAIGMWTGLAIMAVLFAVVSLFPEQVLMIFTNDGAIIAEGVRYLETIRFTYPFFCVTTILLCVLQSTQVVRIALLLSCSTLCINCCINWLLIYGNCGLPRLGVTGAAIGTLTARITELGILLIFLAKREKNLHLRPGDFLQIDRDLVRDYFRVGLPVFGLKGVWGLNTAMQTAVLGHLSSAAIAANSMASNLFLMVKTMATGEANAANVIIGKSIGEGRSEEELRRMARSLQVVFACMGLICGLILLALSEPVLSLYSFSEESRSLARIFLRILVVVMVFMSYQMPVNSGIIKGGGDAAFVMALDVIFIGFVVVPLSLTAAFVLNASPVVVVMCLNIDQVLKCLPAFIKVNYGHWMKKLTR